MKQPVLAYRISENAMGVEVAVLHSHDQLLVRLMAHLTLLKRSLFHLH